jgi:hypothetical protein
MVRGRVRSWAIERRRWAYDHGGGGPSVVGKGRPGVTNVGGRQGRHPAPLAPTEDRALLFIFLLAPGRGKRVIQSTTTTTTSSSSSYTITMTSSPLPMETVRVTLTLPQGPEDAD